MSDTIISSFGAASAAPALGDLPSMLKDAWARELQQAQSLGPGWFHGPLAPQVARPCVAEIGVTGTQELRSAAKSPSRQDDQVSARGPVAPGPSVRALPLHGPGAQHASWKPHVRDLGSHAQAPCPQGIASRECESPTAVEPTSCPPAVRVPGSDLSHAEPVRVHVERGLHGAIVWLGIDGDATLVSTRTMAILRELRGALGASHDTLELLVCNGVPVYAQSLAIAPVPPRSKETSWP